MESWLYSIPQSARGPTLCQSPPVPDYIHRPASRSAAMINTGKCAGKALLTAVGSRGISNKIASKAVKDGSRMVPAVKETGHRRPTAQQGRCSFELQGEQDSLLAHVETSVKRISALNDFSANRSSLRFEDLIQRSRMKATNDKTLEDVPVNALLPKTRMRSSMFHISSGRLGLTKPTYRLTLGQVRDMSTMPSIGGIDGVITTLNEKFNADIVNETQAIYQFNIVAGDRREIYYIDLRNGSGRAGKGKSDENPDTIFCIDAENFNKLVSGTLKGPTAYMKGKMKISGSMQKAVKLEKLFMSLLNY